MKKRIKITAILLCFLAGMVHASAITVSSSSGNLANALKSANLPQLKELTVSGSMDARDFQFIADNLPALETINLQNVEITEYSDKDALFGNFVTYEKNTLPKLCFMGKGIQSIVLPPSIVEIGEGAFAGCLNLQEITLPRKTERIGDYAFSGAASLAKVSGTTSLEIGEYAFSNCLALSEFTPSGHAHSIGAYAFLHCPALSEFSFGSSLTLLGEGAFMAAGIVEADLSACQSLTAIGAWAFADDSQLKSTKLPPSIEAIGDGAFFYNTSLQKASLPNGISRINDFTFMGDNVPEPNLLPETVTEIGDYAFAEWDRTQFFSIPASVEKIGERAFRNWDLLRSFDTYAEIPPALGNDVWEGTDKTDVFLRVPPGSIQQYKSAEQWRDFTMMASETEISCVPRLTAVVDNGILRISSPTEIVSASLYDLSGVLLSEKHPGTVQVQFDLNNYSGKIYLVRCNMADNNVEFVKIGRN